jgi:pyruvate formate lyase activating enzyme
MRFKGWVKSSLLDYPGQIATSLFCGGCNFRCPNCQNADLVLRPDELVDVQEGEIGAFLERRRGLVDAVVLSGGEPTLQPDLLSFAARLRAMGFLVKLDTNGYRPDVLQAAIAAQAVDYVAMDVKAPPARYALAAGVEVDVRRIQRSVDLLRAGKVAYEFRTTVVPGLLEEEDILQIAQWIAGAQQYYLQQFSPHGTLDPDLSRRAPYPPARIQKMADLSRRWVMRVGVRGVE